MKLHLTRTHIGEKYTFGRLSIDGQQFCDTLELPEKVDGKSNVKCRTCIPVGTYSVQLAMSPSFKRNLPRLQNVPGRTDILIHRGNTTADTSGCILIGHIHSPGVLADSAATEIRLVQQMQKDKACEITIE